MKLKSRFIAGMFAAILGITTLQIPLPYVYAEEQNPEVIVRDTAENYEQISEREEDFPIEDTEISDTANLEIGLEETESVSENANENADMSSKETDETADSETEEGQADIDDPTESDQEIPGSLEELEEELMYSDSAVKATGENIASGTYKNEQDGSDISWVIDADGKLTVEGTGNFSDSTDEDRAPWFGNRLDIKLAEIDVTGMTDASYMFYRCINLSNINLKNFDTSNVTNMNNMFRNCEILKNIDVSNFNTGKITSMSGMFLQCYGLTNLDVSGFNTDRVTAMNGMFYGCGSLTNLDVSGFNTSKVTRMNSMFYGCGSLTNLDLSSFDTGQVTDMCYMFSGCGLASLNLSSFDTSQVTNMSYMFSDCRGLKSIDLSSFDTSQVTDMRYMFFECQSLTNINIDNFDTSKVTDMRSMFEGCVNVKRLCLGNFDIGSLPYNGVVGMFEDCSNLTYLDISNFGSIDGGFHIGTLLESCISLATIYAPSNLSKDIVLPVETGDNWYDFEGNVYTKLPLSLNQSIILSKNKIPVISNPYITLQKDKTVYECGEKLDLDDLTVTYYDETGISTVVNDYITNIDQIDMSTPGKKILTVTYSYGNDDLAGELEITVNDKEIENEPISGNYENIVWNIDSNGKLTVEGKGDFAASTGSSHYEPQYYTRAPWYEYRNRIISVEVNVHYMYDASYMFYGCTNLVSVDFRHFDTSRVSNMHGMFRDCEKLITLDLSNFDTGQVRCMAAMFNGCSSLTDLKLDNFDTRQVTDMGSMFSDCSSLTSLDLSCFDVSEVSTMNYMFWECRSLTNINLSSFNTSNQLRYIADMFSGCSSLVELDLSSLDGSEVNDFISWYGDDNVFSMFEGCNSLTTIYTPYNLMRCYQLPGNSGDIWYQPDGSEITILPTVCDSMKIMKNKVPVIGQASITATLSKTNYVCGDFIATRGLTVKYYGSDGTVKKVTDYTTNEDEIDMSTPGKKTLVVTYNGLSAEIEMNVSEPWIDSIIMSESSLTLSKGETATLHADIFPQSALSLPVTWQSSDPSVVKVLYELSSRSVCIKGESVGESTITVSAGDKTASCLVTVVSDQADDDIASGKYEKVSWRIDANGKLTVEGSGDFSNLNSTNRAPWFEKRASIKAAEINLKGTTNAAYMFYDCQNVTDIDVSGFDTSNVTDMTWTFRDCSSLTDLDLSSFKTGSVTRMKWMFKGCNSLKNLNVNHFDTANVVDMGGMFDGCSSLISLDLSSFNTENVRYMNDKGGMFSDCSSLTSLDVSHFNTQNVVDMSYLFMNCKNLTKLDLSSFNTENVTAMDGMFSGCSNLTNLDISSFNTKNVSSMSGMFSGGGLASLNLSNFDVGNVTNFAAFFEVCHKLSTIYVPCNLKMSVKLPEGYTTDSADIWYDIDGNTYTELPQNLSRSIILTRNQKPVISEPHITLEKQKTSYSTGEKLTTDDLKVTYYNETGIPSTVTDYTTNADEIDMSTPGTKTLVVTYRNLYAEISITVSEKQTGETKGLKITFKNEQDKEVAYTGSAVKPEIRVSYNGRSLVEGTNYTVKYANNIKVGSAKITVTGKGNFKSGKTENFKIVKADIADAVFAGTDRLGCLVVVSGSGFSPAIYCGGRKLTANDYTISGTVTAGKQVTDSDSDKVITLNGKGSYKGNKKITLRVVRKSDLIKFTVTLDKTKLDSLTYDGKAHYIHEIRGALTVTGKDGNSDMKYGTDYMIAYPANVKDAGTKKFSVIGMGLYTGTISKSYTIKPAVNTNGALEVKYESGNIENIKLPYVSTGVTFNDQLKVTYTRNGNTLTLREGKDYRVTYSGNKKVGRNAKFTISFLGNYKGIQKQTRIFAIEKAELGDSTVIIPDAVYKKTPGIYKSVPYVIESETGRLIKASNYTVTYYTDPARNMEMKGKNKVAAGDTVYVKLEAKPNSNYKSVKPLVKTYQVANAIDLSKAKISFMSAETGTSTKSAEYTGQKITDHEIKVLVNGKPADADMIVTYANNIDKGKATVIVTGTGKPECRYTGCKKATFQIVAYSLR